MSLDMSIILDIMSQDIAYIFIILDNMSQDMAYIL